MDALTEPTLLLELDRAIEEFHRLREELQATSAGIPGAEQQEIEQGAEVRTSP